LNTTNINNPELAGNSNIHFYTTITLDELEKALKLTGNCKCVEEDNINTELYKIAPHGFQ
jgi:hypothetical protein